MDATCPSFAPLTFHVSLPCCVYPCFSRPFHEVKTTTPINQQILIPAVGPPAIINLSLVNEFLSFWDYNQLHPIIIGNDFVNLMYSMRNSSFVILNQFHPLSKWYLCHFQSISSPLKMVSTSETQF